MITTLCRHSLFCTINESFRRIVNHCLQESAEKHANISVLQMLAKVVFYLTDVEKYNACAVEDVWSAKPDVSSNK